MPWLYRARLDIPFILLPPFLVTAWVLLSPSFFNGGAMPPWFWLLFVVGIDVAHVYSTLYRTYLHRQEYAIRRSLFLWVPLLVWLGGMLLYTGGHMTFWRVLAYLAVYHFVRQQYGFFRLYARKEQQGRWARRLEAATIYMCALYPLIHWHTHLPRPFSWFLAGDFMTLPGWIEPIALVVYVCLLISYMVKELLWMKRGGRFNLPKQLVLAGTAISWYVGTVWAQGDMAFTAINVVSHGIPYMALIWAYGRKRGDGAIWFKQLALPVFIGLIIVLAYFEEGLWDGLVWRDHEEIFGWDLPYLQDKLVLSIVVPLLAMPQVTHYVLDGFIWRLRKDKQLQE